MAHFISRYNGERVSGDLDDVTTGLAQLERNDKFWRKVERDQELDRQLAEAGIFDTMDLVEIDRELQQENSDLADLIIAEQYGLTIAK